MSPFSLIREPGATILDLTPKLLEPAGNSIRNYPQRNRPVSATAVPCPIALRQPTITSFGSLNNHLIDSTNLPIIYQQIPLICRYGRRNPGVKSSDNRQMNPRNRQIVSFLHWQSGSPNCKVIVNRFPVIVISAAWNLSPIHHQNPEIYHRASRQLNIRFLESSDNHPIEPENHPTESANLPTIDRQFDLIHRPSSRRFAEVDSQPILSCKAKGTK